MFTLLKVDDEWKIMNKVFHLHPEGEKFTLAQQVSALGSHPRFTLSSAFAN